MVMGELLPDSPSSRHSSSTQGPLVARLRQDPKFDVTSVIYLKYKQSNQHHFLQDSKEIDPHHPLFNLLLTVELSLQ